jgi:hypothetical protein
MTLASGCCVDEGSISKKPFAAVYKVTVQGESPHRDHVFYDGNGHVRSQTIAPYSDNVFLIDFRRNEGDGIMESTKQYCHITGLQSYPICMFDEAAAKAANAKPLGAKKIGQYQCHGWRYIWKEGPREVWTSDDYGCPVSDSFKNQGKNVTRHLIGYEGSTVVDGLFKVPDGYKQMYR